VYNGGRAGLALVGREFVPGCVTHLSDVDGGLQDEPPGFGQGQWLDGPGWAIGIAFPRVVGLVLALVVGVF